MKTSVGDSAAGFRMIPAAVALGLDKFMANLNLISRHANEGRKTELGARQITCGCVIVRHAARNWAGGKGPVRSSARAILS
jgi:hypothetical protein